MDQIVLFFNIEEAETMANLKNTAWISQNPPKTILRYYSRVQSANGQEHLILNYTGTTIREQATLDLEILREIRNLRQETPPKAECREKQATEDDAVTVEIDQSGYLKASKIPRDLTEEIE